jgi:uncharacterized protein
MEVLHAEMAGNGADPDYSQALSLLTDICKDPAVPRSVKKRVEDVVAKLSGKDRTMQVRINSCTFILDDISNDPGVPPHTRTFIWQVAGLLESAGKAERVRMNSKGN